MISMKTKEISLMMRKRKKKVRKKYRKASIKFKILQINVERTVKLKVAKVIFQNPLILIAAKKKYSLGKRESVLLI